MSFKISTDIREAFGDTQGEIFELNQLLLPQEERVCIESMCAVRHYTIFGIPYLCTRETNHTGDHIAHGLDGNVYSRWSER